MFACVIPMNIKNVFFFVFCFLLYCLINFIEIQISIQHLELSCLSFMQSFLQWSSLPVAKSTHFVSTQSLKQPFDNHE